MTGDDQQNHRMETGEKRGDSTRAALIAAGVVLFSDCGVKGTTTRMLAQKSGANIAAIPYHFGSKEGLYHAVIAYIVDRMSTYMTEITQDIRPALEQGSMTSEEARAAFEHIMLGMSRFFVESDEPKAWAQIIMREQASPTDAYDLLYNGQIVRMQRMLASLAGLATGLDPASDEVKIRVHALMGQILGFLVNRENLLRHLGVRQLGREQVALVKNILVSHVGACLQVPPLEKGVS